MMPWLDLKVSNWPDVGQFKVVYQSATSLNVEYSYNLNKVLPTIHILNLIFARLLVPQILPLIGELT